MSCPGWRSSTGLIRWANVAYFRAMQSVDVV